MNESRIRRRLGLPLLAVMALGLTACASAPTTPETDPPDDEVAPTTWAPDPIAEADYVEQVELAQDNHRAVDYRALRDLYTRTRFYQPYAGAEQQFSEAMFRAMERERDREALQLAGRILQENYVSLDAHYVARAVYARQQDQRRAERHDYILRALFQAIRDSGDGESRATAFQVISSQELSTFISLYGLDLVENELAVDELGPFDRVVARDPDTDQRYELWFDISRQWHRGFDGF